MHAVNCGYPLEQQLSNVPESELIDPAHAVSSDCPITEGTNATFSCPREFALIGPNTSRCMQNGQWAPNPREVKCTRKGTVYHPYSIILL